MKPVSSKLLYRYIYQSVMDISPTTFCIITGFFVHGRSHKMGTTKQADSAESACSRGAPSGARTLDPNIKSVVLYQLS